MQRRAFFAGLTAGAGLATAGFLLSGFGSALDAGISRTHAAEVARDLRRESDVLKTMAEPHWLDLPRAKARQKLIALGVFDFDKGTEGLAAGPVFLKLESGRVSELQTHCARLITGDCPERGTN